MNLDFAFWTVYGIVGLIFGLVFSLPVWKSTESPREVGLCIFAAVLAWPAWIIALIWIARDDDDDEWLMDRGRRVLLRLSYTQFGQLWSFLQACPDSSRNLGYVYFRGEQPGQFIRENRIELIDDEGFPEKVALK